VFALRVRFFQRNGYDAAAAVSSGAIASTASWTAKILLFLVSVGFAAGDFHPPAFRRPPDGDLDRGRRHTRGGDRHHTDHLRTPAAAAGEQPDPAASGEYLGQHQDDRRRAPQDLLYSGGSVLAQLFVVMALGASLHAVGQRASIATCSWSSPWLRSSAEPSLCPEASASWRRA
jgi:hypothetical protein